MKARIDGGGVIFDSKMRASFYKLHNLYIIIKLFSRVVETMFWDEAEKYWNENFEER